MHATRSLADYSRGVILQKIIIKGFLCYRYLEGLNYKTIKTVQNQSNQLKWSVNFHIVN